MSRPLLKWIDIFGHYFRHNDYITMSCDHDVVVPTWLFVVTTVLGEQIFNFFCDALSLELYEEFYFLILVDWGRKSASLSRQNSQTSASSSCDEVFDRPSSQTSQSFSDKVCIA